MPWSTQVQFLPALLLFLGCAAPPTVLDCQADVLEPYLGDAARQTAVLIDGGAIDPNSLFLSLGVTPAGISELAGRYLACAPRPNIPTQLEQY